MAWPRKKRVGAVAACLLMLIVWLLLDACDISQCLTLIMLAGLFGQLVQREGRRHIPVIRPRVFKRKRRRRKEHRQRSISGIALPDWRQPAIGWQVRLLGSSPSSVHCWCWHVPELCGWVRGQLPVGTNSPWSILSLVGDKLHRSRGL